MISGLAQNSIKDDLAFSRYLFSKRQYEDVIHLLSKTEQVQLSTSYGDTINYMLGKSYYQTKTFDLANEYFSRVTQNQGILSHESSFFRSYVNLQLNNISVALESLRSIKSDSSLVTSLQNFEEAGIYLLDRNLEQFDKISPLFDHRHYQFSEQQKRLLEIRKDIAKHKTRSPLIAGLMSTVIPGSGKIYAGKTGQGIISTLTSGLLALQTLEAYRKDGTRSATFWIFGSVFSIFYIGNIWGSVLTVNLTNNEFNEAINHQILFDLHIPLRTIFH